jgi:hypothetical protein
MGFEHQEPSTNLGFCHTAARPQQIGVRLKPNEKKTEAPKPERPPEPRDVRRGLASASSWNGRRP